MRFYFPGIFMGLLLLASCFPSAGSDVRPADPGIRLSGTGRVDLQAAKDNLSKTIPMSGKEIALQPGVANHPDFSWDRTAESENFIIYWGGRITGDPADFRNGDLRFEPDRILETLEDILDFLTDSIRFIDNADTGNMSRYKHEVVMNETWTGGAFQGWAFGGWVRDGMAGGIWVHPRAAADAGLLAHELTHACQAMVMVQYPGFGLNAAHAGFFWESHAEYIRAVYTGSYEASFIPRYLNTSMQHYSTTRRYYQNLYFLDYLSDTYGMEAINLIWRRANPHHSHPLTALRDEVLGYTQQDLNDDFLRHAMRNVSWDYENGPLILRAMDRYPETRFSRDLTCLEVLHDGSGRYVAPAYMAPGDYGYNIIQLIPENGAAKIDIEFASLENAEAGGGGNRYGFVAVGSDNQARYSEVFHGDQKHASFSLSQSDASVFLVVTGAPERHHNYGWETGFTQEYRYPYTLTLSGAAPSLCAAAKVNSPPGAPATYSRKAHPPGAPPSNETTSITMPPGAQHPRGGGWVAATALVDPGAYVGPHARVTDNARVGAGARISGQAVVGGDAIVDGQAVVGGLAIVGGNSLVGDQALVTGSARVFNSTVGDNAIAGGYALLYHASLLDDAVATDLAWLDGVTARGTTIMGGNAEGYHQCAEGIYLQEPGFVRTSGCDGQTDHPMNRDINPGWEVHHYPVGNIPAAPLGLRLERAGKHSMALSWDPAGSHHEIVRYYLEANGRLMGVATDTVIGIGGLQPGQVYRIRVMAMDGHGRLSPRSAELRAETVDRDVPDAWLSERLRVYPNPSDNEMHIKLEDGKIDRLMLYDRTGRLIYAAHPGQATYIISRDMVGRGLFLLQVFSGKDTFTTTLVFL